MLSLKINLNTVTNQRPTSRIQQPKNPSKTYSFVIQSIIQLDIEWNRIVANHQGL